MRLYTIDLSDRIAAIKYECRNARSVLPNKEYYK